MRLDELRNQKYTDCPMPPLALPNPDPLFLLAVIFIAGTVTALQVVEFGGTSGLGWWTIAIALAGWALWVTRPYFPRGVTWVVLPLAGFNVFATLSLFWGASRTPGTQLVMVTAGCLALMLLAAREAERDERFVRNIHRMMDVASLTAAVAYTGVVLLIGQGGEFMLGGRPVFLARPFALFACLALARQLSRWQAGDERGLWMSLWLAGLIFLSHSRLALVVGAALFPLCLVTRGQMKSFVTSLVLTALAAAALGAAIFLHEPMYRRFFSYDVKFEVGGVGINASGRSEVWQTLLDDMNGSIWLFGHGLGASSRKADEINPLLGHPHNDFLRYLYDLGGFGLGLFVLFLLAAVGTTLAATVRAARARGPDLPVHMTPLLGLAVLMAAMGTDNPVSYVYLMAPLGVLLGCSLGRIQAQHTDRAAAGTVRVAHRRPRGAAPQPAGAGMTPAPRPPAVPLLETMPIADPPRSAPAPAAGPSDPTT